MNINEIEMLAKGIAGFHCHTIIKTIQQIKSRIKEEKEDEYSNSVFNIGRNVLRKFIRLCMETPYLCPSEGHKYGNRKLTKTYVIEFSIKSLWSSTENLCENLLSCKDCSDC